MSQNNEQNKSQNGNNKKKTSQRSQRSNYVESNDNIHATLTKKSKDVDPHLKQGIQYISTVNESRMTVNVSRDTLTLLDKFTSMLESCGFQANELAGFMIFRDRSISGNRNSYNYDHAYRDIAQKHGQMILTDRSVDDQYKKRVTRSNRTYKINENSTAFHGYNCLVKILMACNTLIGESQMGEFGPSFSVKRVPITTFQKFIFDHYQDIIEKEITDNRQYYTSVFQSVSLFNFKSRIASAQDIFDLQLDLLNRIFKGVPISNAQQKEELKQIPINGFFFYRILKIDQKAILEGVYKDLIMFLQDTAHITNVVVDGRNRTPYKITLETIKRGELLVNPIVDSKIVGILKKKKFEYLREERPQTMKLDQKFKNKVEQYDVNWVGKNYKDIKIVDTSIPTTTTTTTSTDPTIGDVTD